MTNKMNRLKQSEYYYTISPFRKPVLTITPGDTIIAEVPDAFAGKIKSNQDKISPPWNPLAGPVYIENAEEGSTLAIDIKNIKIIGKQGVSILFNFTDPLTSILLNPKMEPRVIPIKDNKICFAGMTTPSVTCEPSIGCIGTSPKNEAISSDYAGPYGGNMDTPVIRPGNRLFLPVNVRGGLLYFGDVHAIQGDGEFFALDVPAEVTLTVNVMKEKKIGWPRVESPSHIMTIVSLLPLESAILTAYKELVLWIEEEYGLERWDAYQLCTQAATIYVHKVVEPTPTVVLKFPKKYLPKNVAYQ